MRSLQEVDVDPRPTSGPAAIPGQAEPDGPGPLTSRRKLV
jgi:hypothetical protein